MSVAADSSPTPNTRTLDLASEVRKAVGPGVLRAGRRLPVLERSPVQVDRPGSTAGSMASTSREPSGLGPAFDAEYDALPEPLKMIYSPKEYAWLPPELRARVIEQECLPEVPED
jgi:hypothetical protein